MAMLEADALRACANCMLSFGNISGLSEHASLLGTGVLEEKVSVRETALHLLHVPFLFSFKVVFKRLAV